MVDQTRTRKKKNQLVTFRLGLGEYGIAISKIQEVLNFREVTALPNAPDFIEGVIRVRERVIPIVDLRKRLGIEEKQRKKDRIVVLDLEQPLGMIVTDISRVLNLEDSDYEDLPEAVAGDPEKNCISQLAKVEQDLVIVISPERILSAQDQEKLKEMG